MGRATAIADRVENVNNEVITLVEGLTDAQLKTTTSPEQWSIGVLAHHIATSNPAVAGMASAVAAGHPIPSFTMDMIHAGNAHHATEFSNVTKAEVLTALRDGNTKATEMVRGLSDEALSTSVSVLTGAPPMTVEQIIEGIIIEHTRGHLDSMKATVAG